TFDIKTSKNSWKIFEENKSLKKYDIFAKITESLNKGKSKEVNKEVINSLGDNLVFSINDFKAEKKKSDADVLAIVEIKSKDASKKIFNMLKKENPKSKEAKYKNYNIVGVIEKNTKDKVQFYYCFIDKYILFSDKKNIVEQSINTYMKTVPSISDSKDFSDNFNNLKDPYQVQFYVNIKKIAKSLASSKEYDETYKELSTVNLESLLKSNGMLMNINFDSSLFRFVSNIAMDPSSELSVDGNKIKYNKFASMLPKETLLLAQYADIEKTITTVKNQLSKMEEKGTKELKEVDKLITDSTGIEIKEIIDNVKDDLAFSIFNTDETPLIPSIAMIMTPKNKDKIFAQLGKFKLDIGSMMEEKDSGNRKNKDTSTPKPKKDIIMTFSDSEKYKDIDIFETNFIEDFKEMGLRPSYAFVNDKMILASSPSAIKAIIDRINNPSPEFNLNSNTVFGNANKMYNQDYTGTMFLNFKQILNLVSPLLAGIDKDKSITSNLSKIESVSGSSSQDKNNFGGKFLVSADFKNMDFKGLIDFLQDNGKVKVKSTTVKANQHMTQTIAETFAVDNMGFYPDTVKALEKEAKNNKLGASYWKDFKNPYTNSVAGSLIDYKAYSKANAKKLKGAVLYQPLKCSFDKTKKQTLCSAYKIYGLDDKGNFVLDANGKQNVLSSL
ncbi:MAG: DUF3352 domain-containing protein, partial [Cyanobacteriota bacterium]